MDKQAVIMIDEQRRQYAHYLVDQMPLGTAVEFKDVTRTLEQNAFQWPYLQGFSEQLQWPVNGEKVWLVKDEWKDVLTCAFDGDVSPRIASAWEGGGVVMLGKRTSQFGKKRFAEWMEWLIAAATLKGIKPIFKHGLRWTR